jgi:hypothetical protein
MDVDVAVEAIIPFPREVVTSYAGDPSNAPEWYANIVSVRWRTPAPVAVGSQMDFEARFLGRRLTYTYEVVELVAGERLVMRTADGPFPMETTYTWDPVPGGTVMRLRNRGTPSGFAALATPALRRAMKAAMTKDLVRLTERLQRR